MSGGRVTKFLARLGVLAAVTGAVHSPVPALAHGIGGRRDLPVPASFFVVGAAVVLVASFVALAVLWPEPRWQDPPPVRPLNAPWLAPAAAVLGAVGVAALVLVVLAGVLDGRGRANAGPVLVWVFFWLVVPFLSALIGNWWRYLNPWRTVARLASLGDEERPELVARWGVWPATVAFVAFTWLELVYGDSGDPRTLSIAAIVYTAYVLALIGYAGRRTALGSGEAFTTYNGLLSAIAPIGRDAEGRLVWRGWLRALPHVPPRAGLVAFVVAMIGTVTYDGLSATSEWRELIGGLAGQRWFGTFALLDVVALIGAAYWLACWVAARLAGGEWTPTAVARSFAHTLIPIALAYAFAHYFTLVLFEGQLVIPALSDPFGRGWNLFGTAGHQVNFFLSANAVWYLQVGAIVGGHVAGVVLAHDRALADFGPVEGVRTQYAMLGLMVALTMLGLTLLAS